MSMALAFPIRVPSDLLEELGALTGKFWSSLDLEPIICDAIRAYMKPPPATQPQPAAASEAGYQWKAVFLPNGTRLRASFGREHYFASVEGAEIEYGDHAISPSCFANLYGSGNRNSSSAQDRLRTGWPPQAPCDKARFRKSVKKKKHPSGSPPYNENV